MVKCTRICLVVPLLVAHIVMPAIGAKRLSTATPLRAPATSARQLQERLRPYLEARLRHMTLRGEVPANVPTQDDLLQLLRYWKALSPEFQQLYTQATAIPPGMLSYTSPGGRIDVIYAISGEHAVDTTDRYGYTPGAQSWRIRSEAPNGIPDYIDEVAWAGDSAWSMIIERLGFMPPLARISADYPSERYKVAALRLSNSLYGMTVPGAPVTTAPSGWSSHIELRNNWDGAQWRDVGGINYEANPHWAVRVTCAHELFHGVQYAMAHSVVGGIHLDDFPVMWIEATAVLMEDLMADSVNDYIQYCGAYFNNPRDPVLSIDGGTYNSTPAGLFLYEFGPGPEPVGFIRAVFYANHHGPLPYAANLQHSALSLGSQWRFLLNRFHARSFFTGSRAIPGMFLKDAALLPQWSYVPRADGLPQTKSVRRFGMNYFSRTRHDGEGDTLRVYISTRRLTPAVVLDSLWGASVLLKRSATGRFDTTLEMRIRHDGVDSVTIPGWSACDEALVVVSNAGYGADGEVTASFNQPLELPPSPKPPIPGGLTLHPNPLRLSRDASLRVQGNAIRGVQIYGIDGCLLYTATGPPAGTPVIDIPLGRGGLSIGHGSYIAIIESDNALSQPGFSKRKLLVLP